MSNHKTTDAVTVAVTAAPSPYSMVQISRLGEETGLARHVVEAWARGGGSQNADARLTAIARKLRLPLPVKPVASTPKL